jgi:general secretion pathway protein K
MMARRPRKPTEHSRGLALITVLWLLALLTLLASAMVAVSVTSRKAAARLEDSVQADVAADSAIRLTQVQMIENSRVASGLLAGPRQISFAGAQIEVTVQEEAGRIDLNDADPQLLFALLAANGWEPSQAQAMIDRINAWRELARASVPAAPDLNHAGRPAHRFESVDELRQIEGSDKLTVELFDSLTVYTHASMPRESVASPAVLSALQWADEHQLEGHRWRTSQTDAQATEASEASEAELLVGQVLRVRACARLHANLHCRQAVIRPTGNVDRPFQVFEWSSDSR